MTPLAEVVPGFCVVSSPAGVAVGCTAGAVLVCVTDVVVEPTRGVVVCVETWVVLTPLGDAVPGFGVVSSPATVVVDCTPGAVVVWITDVVVEPRRSVVRCVESWVVLIPPGEVVCGFGVFSPATVVDGCTLGTVVGVVDLPLLCDASCVETVVLLGPGGVMVPGFGVVCTSAAVVVFSCVVV